MPESAWYLYTPEGPSSFLYTRTNVRYFLADNVTYTVGEECQQVHLHIKKTCGQHLLRKLEANQTNKLMVDRVANL